MNCILSVFVCTRGSAYAYALLNDYRIENYCVSFGFLDICVCFSPAISINVLDNIKGLLAYFDCSDNKQQM